MMAIQTTAQIYLADQRGCSRTDHAQSDHTFNCGAYQAEGRGPFGALHLLNDNQLRPGGRLTQSVSQSTQVVLLPVTGGLEYTFDSETDFLEPGQTGVLTLPGGATYTVSNPYEQETIQFLQLELAIPSPNGTSGGTQNAFDLAVKNTLLPIFESTGNRGFIGRYDGRQEGLYRVEPTADRPSKGVFIFVLQGVFEVANRLLHAKDGLSLYYENTDVVEFEALSREAILLLIELGV